MSDIRAPADEKSTMSYRAARLAVIVLSALIILALIGLVGGVAWKLMGRGAGGTAAAPGAGVFVLPKGATIVASDVQSGRLVLHVRSAQGEEIDIVSLDDGHLVARIGPQ